MVLNCPVFAQDLFDPDGYYFPEKDIVIEGYKIEYFMLHSISRYDPNDESIDPDHPKRITPIASLRLIRTKDNKYFPYHFNNPVIEQNGVILSSSKTSIGTVTIKGKFLDMRGGFWNLNDVVTMKTPVFEGTVSVMRDGKLAYEKIGRFTYWEGD